MIQRKQHTAILTSLKSFPVTGLIGSRQVGKSTLARLIAEQNDRYIFLDLEKDSDCRKLTDAELYLSQYKDALIILDEIQRKPELFPLLRSLVDMWGGNEHFLILGSASPSLLRQSSESLAGRIEYLELTPFLADEIQTNTLKLWSRGGYPRSFLAETDEESFRWRTAFARTYLERDIPQLGIKIPSTSLNRFWQMMAHMHGQLWNASKIAQSLSITPPTSRHYLDILEDTFIARQISPYFVNNKKRLVKSPKVYFRDSGILHYILGIHSLDQLLGNPVAGASWEGFVIEQIINHHPPHSREFYFYRTSSGAEIDLVFAPSSQPPVAIEIKLSTAPVISRGFREAFSDLGCTRGYYIYNGNERYPMDRNIFALPLVEIDEIFR